MTPGCSKGEYKRRKEDEIGENLLVICLNNEYNLQTACLIHLLIQIFGVWAILDHF